MTAAERVCAFLEEAQVYYLATVEGDQPRVRPFGTEMVYEGSSCTLYHFDLYRLEDASELDDTGIFDVLGADGVCVIEWGEQFAKEIGDERLDIILSRRDDEAEPGVEPARTIDFRPLGCRAKEIVAALGV